MKLVSLDAVLDIISGSVANLEYMDETDKLCDEIMKLPITETNMEGDTDNESVCSN